jgi:GntR family transcriptional repressor for pyruvate dehydrogenase complex
MSFMQRNPWYVRRGEQHMALREIRNRSLSDQVFEQLVTEIISSRYPAGDSLPAERALATTLGVNRHVIREAIRRLEQVGLVRVVQGGSTRVLDYRTHAGLDLLGLLANHARGGAESLRFWLSMLEMRAAISTELVRLCARRADRGLQRELLELSEQMQRAADDPSLHALDVRFWERIAEGSGSLVGRLALNSLLRATAALGELAQQWSAEEVRQADYRRPLAAAIAKSDADLAEKVTRKASRASVELFEAGSPSARRRSSLEQRHALAKALPRRRVRKRASAAAE